MNDILCIIDTLGFGGGAERQMAGLAGMLHQKGYNVTLATYHKHDMNPWLEKKYGIKSIMLNCNNSQWDKFKAVRSFIKNGKFKTVIAYKDGAAMISCLCKITGLRFKLVVSERNTTTALTRYERRKFLLYKVADVIVPNSYSQGVFITKHYPRLSKKVNVITNFTDTEEFTPPVVGPNYESVLNVLITARIAPQKNILPFMHVVRRLKEDKIRVRFNWYGGVYYGKDEYGSKVMEEYNKLDIGDYLEFHTPTMSIADVYRECDAFCLPSLYEGYPNVVCEAMSCGKPILCSRVCDNSKIVEDGINGFLFDPTDENDMYRVISVFCTYSRKQIEEMGKKSREIAEKKFSMDSFVSNYMKII